MRAFEDLSVFTSIIMGLAVVHLLGGISLMLDRRIEARGSWIDLTWVVNLFAEAARESLDGPARGQAVRLFGHYGCQNDTLGLHIVTLG